MLFHLVKNLPPPKSPVKKKSHPIYTEYAMQYRIPNAIQNTQEMDSFR